MNKKNIDSRYPEKSIRIELDGKKILITIAVITICLGGVALRLCPLAQSPYPYILDGLGEARYAGDIVNTGSIAPDFNASYSETHTISTPLFDTFLAMSSLLLSEDPLFLIQMLIGLFAGMLLIGAYVFSSAFTGSNRVGIISMMSFAAYGPFVIVTQASWKECIGLSMLPLILMSFYHRDNPRMRILSSILILTMPFLHHLIALVVILIVCFVTSTEFLIAKKKKNLSSKNLLDVIIAIIAVDETLVYYSVVKFDRLDYLTPQNGLYLFIGLAILIAIGIYYIAGRRITKSWSKAFQAIVSICLIILLAINIMTPIGTIETNAYWAISLPLVACLIFIIFGIWGFSIFSTTMEKSKSLYFALLSAPITLIIYALLRAEDLLSLDIITRTIDLADIGMFVGIGIAIAFIIKDWKKVRSIGIAVIMSAVLISTIPIALDSEKYVGTRNTVFSFEIDGIEWATIERGSMDIQTDVQFNYVRYLFDNIDDPTLVRRFFGTATFESDTLMIGSERWVTIGVKDLPYGWVRIEESSFYDKIAESDLLYAGGPQDIGILIFRSPI